MRIVLLSTLFLPKRIGGTEVATFNIAKCLAKRGHEVHVITSWDVDLPSYWIEEGFWVHRIRWPRVKLMGIAYFWMKIIFHSMKINPDIIHSQGMETGIPAFISKVLMGKPYVVWGQGSDMYLPWNLKNQILKVVIKNADSVIALTEDMRQEMNKVYEREVNILPNGIKLSNFSSLNKKKKEKGIIRILFVGTLHSIKGVVFLIEAMRILHELNSKIQLMIVGDGKDREELEKLVIRLCLTQSVIFVGRVPNEEIPEYMNNADIFVLPSLSEGFPVVLLEAMASGLPIVTTNVKGLPEIIKDNVNGFTVNPSDSKIIAEKIHLLLDNPELMKVISENNKRKATIYDWENIVTKLEEIYRLSINR